MPRRRGVTLLELLLSMGLLVLLSSTTYWFYGSSLETGRAATLQARKLRLARVVLDRMSTEIRQASTITADNRVGIRGEAERIWLSTLRVPSRKLSEERRHGQDPPPGEYDLVKVEYKIARHPEIQDDDGYDLSLGLARVELKIPRPDSAQTGEAFENRGLGEGLHAADDALDQALAEQELLGSLEDRDSSAIFREVAWEELYAPELKYLRFCYFDGHSWWDQWDVRGENPLPQMVMVTIGFEGRPPFGEESGRNENEEFCTCLMEDPVDCVPLPSDQFSTIVRVPQADPLFRSRIARETQAFIEQIGQEP